MKSSVFASLMVAVGVFATIAADVILKNSDGAKSSAVAEGALLYAVAAVPVAFAFKYIQFGNLFLIWEVLNIVIGLLLGWIFYAEPLTLAKITACALAFVAMALVY